MFYGKPTKFIRHVTDTTYTLGPQRAQLLPFWYADTGATARTDGADLADEFKMPLGSRITKHKVTMLVSPNGLDPQKLYIAPVKLSFHDVLAPAVLGTEIDQTAYQTGTAGSTTTSHLRFWVDKDLKKANHSSTEFDVSGIDTVLLDDTFKHFVGRLKQNVVFDQRPLMSDKFQRVPSKVKRINDYTWYGLWIFNDAVRGATPADTEVDINLKQYIEEWAL